MAPLARLVLVCLQYIRGQEADAALVVVRAVIDLVRQVYVSRGGSKRLDQVWYYSFKASRLEPEQVRNLLETLLRLVDKRFGTVPDDLRVRVQLAPAAELDRWLDRIFDAPSLDALFDD